MQPDERNEVIDALAFRPARGTSWREVASLLCACTLAVTTWSGCATTRTTGEQFDDAMTTARVARRLSRDPDVPRRMIDVDTLRGQVTLRGEVPDYRSRHEAAQVAARTKGVRVVHDKLVVRPDRELEADGDLAITTRLNNKLIADPDVRAVNVDIDTYDGVVMLSGIVENEEARLEAERLALQTKGVAAVINELEVDREETVAWSR